MCDRAARAFVSFVALVRGTLFSDLKVSPLSDTELEMGESSSPDDVLREILQSRMQAKNLNANDLAAQLGVSNSKVQRFLRQPASYPIKIWKQYIEVLAK